MLKFLVCFFSTCFLIFSIEANDGYTTIKKGSFKVDLNNLRFAKRSDSQINTIRKLSEVLQEKSDKDSFTTIEENNAVEEAKLNAVRNGSVDAMEANYVTKSTFFLHDKKMYLNLDEHAKGSLKTLGSSQVEHCSDKANDVQIGHFIIGSDKVHGEISNEDGAVLARQVTDKYTKNGCTVMQTIPVHHLELFKRATFESHVDIPFQNSFYMETEEKRNLASQFVGPDLPIRACSDTAFDYSWYDVAAKYTLLQPDFQLKYCIGVSCSKFCAQYSKDIPGSFNFNYDFSSGKAITNSLQIANGVTCTNCYLFFGAGFIVIAEYLNSAFMFETKIGGGTGFNAQVDLNNPSISGSKVYSLMGPSNQGYVFPIGGGFTMTSKFGGLSATLSGSGSASGSASFGAGYKTAATIGVMVVNYICFMSSLY